MKQVAIVVAAVVMWWLFLLWDRDCVQQEEIRDLQQAILIQQEERQRTPSLEARLDRVENTVRRLSESDGPVPLTDEEFTELQRRLREEKKGE